MARSTSPSLSIKTSRKLASQTSKLNIKQRSGPADKRKRLAANARERKRMDLLNKAFDQLRGRLNDARNKSKYDVLVQAKEYIQALARICSDHDRDNPEHPSAIASAKAAHECDSAPPIETKPESRTEARHRQLDLTIKSVAPTHHWQHSQPIHSPASSSDCCLSPASLPDSLGSSGSPHCSSQPQQAFYHLSRVHPRQHHLPALDSKTAFLYQAQRPMIKQEPMSEISIDYHQMYHPHYQSLFEAQIKQAPIN